MLWIERKQASQATDVADIKRAEIQWNEKHLVWIDNNGIGLVPTGRDPFARPLNPSFRVVGTASSRAVANACIVEIEAVS